MVNSLQESSSSTQVEGKRTYVLDTSVLLSDPKAINKFEEHDVVIPLVVITELEKKRTDFELGYFARRALRNIEEIRLSSKGLSGRIALPGGGSLLIDTNSDPDILPNALQNGSNDSVILATAKKYQRDRSNATIVSKDLPMRILASVAGLNAEEYKSEIGITSDWTGIEQRDLNEIQMTSLFEDEGIEVLFEDQPPVNTGVVFTCGTASSLAVYRGDNVYQRFVENDVFGVFGRSAEQHIAIQHLKTDAVGIVSLGGKAGTGKSALALLAGLEAVLEHEKYKKVIVFRPLYAVGGQELGFLPGDQSEKMNPWAQAIYDTLGSMVSENVLREVQARNLIEVLPLTHIRGRSLHDAYVIVDEAQSLERNVLLTVLSRIGQNSKVVLTHDVAQRDNLHVGRFDGVASVIEALKGNRLFAHVTLRKSERSAIAELVTNLLDF